MFISNPDRHETFANHFTTPTRHRPVTTAQKAERAEALETRAARLAKTVRQHQDWDAPAPDHLAQEIKYLAGQARRLIADDNVLRHYLRDENLGKSPTILDLCSRSNAVSKTLAAFHERYFGFNPLTGKDDWLTEPMWAGFSLPK